MARLNNYKTVEYDFVELGGLPEKGVLWVTPDNKWTTHMCPEDGCEHPVTLAIFKEHRCSWNPTFESGQLTLSPSILNPKCKAHYFLENGTVRWC